MKLFKMIPSAVSVLSRRKFCVAAIAAVAAAAAVLGSGGEVRAQPPATNTVTILSSGLNPRPADLTYTISWGQGTGETVRLTVDGHYKRHEVPHDAIMTIEYTDGRGGIGKLYVDSVDGPMTWTFRYDTNGKLYLDGGR